MKIYEFKKQSQFMNEDELNKYTHYSPQEGGWFKVMQISSCENCGGNVEEPNSVNISVPEHILQQKGIQKAEEYFAEAWPCDECGLSYCDNCTCTHGEGKATALTPSAFSNDQLIELAKFALEKVTETKQRLESNTGNIRLMPPLWALTMNLNMMSASEHMDQGYATQFSDMVRALQPICLRLKKNFMAKPSQKSINTIVSVLDKVTPMLQEFKS